MTLTFSPLIKRQSHISFFGNLRFLSAPDWVSFQISSLSLSSGKSTVPQSVGDFSHRKCFIPTLKKKTQNQNIFSQFEFILTRNNSEISRIAENLIQIILLELYLKMKKKCLFGEMELELPENTARFSLNENFCILSDNLLFLVRIIFLMFSTVFYKI